MVNGIWQQATDTVVDMGAVTCLDKHGIMAMDKCSELTGFHDTLTTLFTNPHQYLQANDAIIVHVVHKVLQVSFDVFDALF